MRLWEWIFLREKSTTVIDLEFCSCGLWYHAMCTALSDAMYNAMCSNSVMATVSVVGTVIVNDWSVGPAHMEVDSVRYL